MHYSNAVCIAVCKAVFHFQVSQQHVTHASGSRWHHEPADPLAGIPTESGVCYALDALQSDGRGCKAHKQGDQSSNIIIIWEWTEIKIEAIHHSCHRFQQARAWQRVQPCALWPG